MGENEYYGKNDCLLQCPDTSSLHFFVVAKITIIYYKSISENPAVIPTCKSDRRFNLSQASENS